MVRTHHLLYYQFLHKWLVWSLLSFASYPLTAVGAAGWATPPPAIQPGWVKCRQFRSLSETSVATAAPTAVASAVPASAVVAAVASVRA